MTATDPVAPEAMRVAVETYDMEMVVDSDHGSAMAAALFAGIRANEQRVRERIAAEADTYSMEMVGQEGTEDGHPAFAVALSWFADKVRKGMDVDPTEDYEPADGDVVEVIIIGEVTTGGFAIGSRSNGAATQGWSVQDDHTGLEFAFPFLDGVEPRMRALSRAKQQTPQRLPGDDGDSAEEEST